MEENTEQPITNDPKTIIDGGDTVDKYGTQPDRNSGLGESYAHFKWKDNDKSNTIDYQDGIILNLEEISVDVGINSGKDRKQLTFDATPLLDLRRLNVLVVTAPNDYYLDEALIALSLNLQGDWSDIKFKKIIRDKESEVPLEKLLKCKSLKDPVILAYANPKTEFARALLNVDITDADDRIKEALIKRNIFLIYLLTEHDYNSQLLKSSKPIQEKRYAYWEAPVVEMALFEQFGENHNIIISDPIYVQQIDDYGQTKVFEAVQSLTEKNIEVGNYLDELKKKLIELKQQSDENYKQIVEKFEKGNYIEQTLIFTGAFFSNIPFNDFIRIFEGLLGDEKEEPISKEKDAPIPQSYREIWGSNGAKQAKTIEECKLITYLESRSQRVRFVNNNLSHSVREYLLTNKYAYFHRLYDNFESGIWLFRNDVDSSTLPQIINFMLIAVENDRRYSAEWLTDLVLGIKNIPGNGIPDNASLAEVISKLYESERLKRYFLNRLEDLILKMLLSDNPDFKVLVRDFFRTLLSKSNIKETALEMSLKLYKNLQNTEHFPKEEVLNHIKKVFEEGKHEESFSAYQMWIENFPHRELLEVVNRWIDDRELKPASWTIKFAHLFYLDYAITIQKNWVVNEKDSSNFELYYFEDKIKLSQQFERLIKCISVDEALSNWEELLRFKKISTNNEGESLEISIFEEYAFSIEHSLTGLPTLQKRTSPDYSKTYTITGDIIENWFFILTEKDISNHLGAEIEEVEQSVWSEFAEVIKNNVSAKTLKLIITYLRIKANFHTDGIAALRALESAPKQLMESTNLKTSDVKDKVNLLKVRRQSVRFLVQLLTRESD
jgi:hypothetical protein